jgi:uncharacterized protein YjbJ (UPF0337 family)
MSDTPSGAIPSSTPKGPIPGMAAMKEHWKQMVGSAKSTWLRISEAELFDADGDPNILTGLVQRTYAVSRDDANDQVRRFFDKNRPVIK